MKLFMVDGHEVRVWQERGRWGVAVDDVVHRTWFRTEGQATGVGILRAGQRHRQGRVASPQDGTGSNPKVSIAA
jgi:hypothetical protein